MNYSIVAFDIEKYSSDEKTIKLYDKRESLKKIIRVATADANLQSLKNGNETFCDTGDGVFLFLDTNDNNKIIRFLHQVRTIANNLKEIRFRGVFHKGECEKTPGLFEATDSWLDSGRNIIGDGFNTAARYLDSQPLKEFLKTSIDEYFVFGLSNIVYEHLVNDISFEKDTFFKNEFKVKDYESNIYIHSKTDTNIVKKKEYKYSINSLFEQFLCKSDLSEIYGNNICSLADIYIYPELSKEYEHKLGNETIDSEDYIKSLSVNPRNTIISGDELVGKTSFCKKIFRELYDSRSIVPIYIKGSNNYSGKLTNKIDKAIADQYQEKIDIKSTEFMIIIDDFHLIDVSFQQKIINEVQEIKNSYSLLVVDSIYNVNFYEREIVESFESLDIKEFNNKKRNELIRKWMLTESICDDNYRVLDELTDYVNATLLNGIVPSIPFNILIILSEKKVFNPVKSDITSKGYCYQTLIYLALKKAEINDLEFDIYLNFLEYLSFFFFDTNTSSFTLNQYENFITQYGIEYNQPIPIDSLIKKLQISKIFYKNSIGEYHFNSEYIFFFFVAKYLANHKDDSEVNKKIVEIYNSLEIESHGYIGVFIIHHIKDNTILDEIQFNLLLLYEDISEVTLNKDECEFLYNHISELSKLSLKANNSSFKKREERLSIKDKNDEIEKEIQKKNNKRNNDESDSFDINDELSSLRKALRTVEVMGQILKTRTGSFKKDKQKEYFEEAFKVYLRITNRFLLDFKENEQTFLDFFTERINKIEQKKIDESDRYKIAYSTFLNFNIMNFIACIKRTTHTLCSSQILNIVQEVCSEMNTPISKLVSIQSQMWYNKEIPIEQIKKMMTNMEFLEQRILKVLVIDYCELHDVHYRDKQKIASNLDIQLKLLQKDNTK